MIRENVVFWILLINLIAMIITLITMLLTSKDINGNEMNQSGGVIKVIVYLLAILTYSFALGFF